MIPPEVMAKIVKRFHWRLALADMSRNLIETEYDEHFFAVSTHGPYPRDTQILSIRSIAKILGRSLPPLSTTWRSTKSWYSWMAFAASASRRRVSWREN